MTATRGDPEVPVYSPAGSADGAVSRPPLSGAAEGSAVSTTTILCIDDNDVERHAMAHLLRATGFEVREAATGQEGLRLTAGCLDLILLDVQLPDVDGVEVCRILKRTPATAGIPVLLISGARVRTADRVYGLEGGADGYLAKPVEAEEVLAHIRALLRARRAEEALRASESRFRAIIEKGFEPVQILGADGTIRYASPACTAVLGYPPEELVGRDGFLFVHPEDLAETRHTFGQLLQTPGGTAGSVLRCLHKDGSFRWVEARGANLLNEPGVVGVVVNYHDVTDRKRAEDYQIRLAALVNSAADSILTIDEHGVIESVNPGAERMFGYSAGELLGQNVNLLMPSPFREEHDGYLANYLRSGVRKVIGTTREVQGRRKDGSTFPSEMSVSEFRVGGRRLFAGVHHDVSQRKAMEREVLEIAAREQRRLGQDLHDGTGQELMGLNLMAQSLAEALTEQASPEAGLASKIAQGLKRALSQVRALARGLVPVEVDAQGLMAALEELAARVSEQSGAVCALYYEEPVGVEDNVTATHLYRIAQEAVTNALKHGQARRIEIRLDVAGRLAVLRIRDDGVGIGEMPAEPAGLGLRIMRYRAGLINATLTIGPAERGGAEVSCTFLKGASQ